MDGVSRHLLTRVVVAYLLLVVCLSLAIFFLADRIWPVTLLAFGPRWLAAVPLLPLVVLVGLDIRRAGAKLQLGLLTLAAAVLAFGFLDVRLGFQRTTGPRAFRLLTHNLGASHVTADALDRLMREEQVDIAALQECPFYQNDMQRVGWHFFYGGNLCLVSRYPFRMLDVDDADNVWRTGGLTPQRFDIDAPGGRIEVLNVHLSTIRDGVEALWNTSNTSSLQLLAANRRQADQQSRLARELVSRASMPIVIAGDFNLPVESAVYRNHWSDLRNAFSDCGRGLGHTKLTRWFGVRIDHVLLSSRLACSDARVLTSPYGGDHVILIADLVRSR